MLLYGPLLDQYSLEHSGKDDTGLGRWVIMLFKGSEGIENRIVCGYNACYNKKMDSRLSYHQQRRYHVLKKKDRTCPRKCLYNDLIRQLQDWREEGDQIILCMDANEDFYKKSLVKSITARDGLNMNEVVGKFTAKKIGATFFRLSKPID